MIEDKDQIKDAYHSYYNYLRILLKLNHIEHTPTSLQKVESKLQSLLNDLPESALIFLQQRLRQLVQETIRNSSKQFYELLLSKHFKMKTFEPYGLVSYFTLTPLTLQSIDNYGIQINEDFSLSTWINLIITHKSLYQSNKDIIGILGKTAKQFRLRTMNMHNVYLTWLEGYINKENATKKALIDDQGFLPKNWKIYIGIMAVSILRNSYLLAVLENHFLENDGDESWLIHGLDILPKKLKLISRINHVIAFCPWSLSQGHINELIARVGIRIGGGEEVGLSWNMNELMNAVLILIHYQKMAMVANSIGLGSNSALKDINISNSDTKTNTLHTNTNTNIDINETFTSPQSKPKPYPQFKDELIKQLEEMNLSQSPRKPRKPNNNSQTLNLTLSPTTLSNNSPKGNSSDDEFEDEIVDGNFDKHIKDSLFEFVDFDPHKNHYISYFEFNWVDQGIYVLSDLFQSGIEYLNDEIDFIMLLTKNSIGEGNKELNTLPLRIAITYYIEKIFGIIHEDYDYSKVNKLLPIDFKKFIKKISSKSYSIDMKFIDYMRSAFVNEEVLHIILLVASIKARTQLTYLARCIDEIKKNIE